jgi:glycopeptide antibiotics resistance protein
VLWVAGWAAFGLPWTSYSMMAHWGRVRWIPFYPWHRLTDDFLNVLYYIPLGLFGIWYGRSIRGTVGVAVTFSMVCEFAQVFSTRRVPATSDVLSNVGGSLAGVLLCRAILNRPHEEGTR